MAQETSREHLLEIQGQQLAEWKIILKPKVFAELEKRILASNNTNSVLNDMWEIKRGVSIDDVLMKEVRNLF